MFGVAERKSEGWINYCHARCTCKRSYLHSLRLSRVSQLARNVSWTCSVWARSHQMLPEAVPWKPARTKYSQRHSRVSPLTRNDCWSVQTVLLTGVRTLNILNLTNFQTSIFDKLQTLKLWKLKVWQTPNLCENKLWKFEVCRSSKF